MQTSLARRQARRMNGGRRRRGSGLGRKLAVALPLFLFTSMALVAIIGFVGVVGVFAVYSQGLSDPRDLEKIEFIQESVVLDRTGQVELARFSAGERRETVSYQQIPPILIDATTAIEDRSFWTNTGFDPVGILSAAIDTLRGSERGASTITQQLVRQRLLDPELVRDPERLYERKIKEIIQSVRVTEAYPGEEGKRAVITAYLNQNYYGNGSYGVKTAAKGYFGVDDLNDLTLGQAAILAALPQSPSSYDLVRNAVEDTDGTLYVPLDPENIRIVERRNYILELLKTDPSRRVLTGDQYSAEDFEAAQREPIRLVPQQRSQRWLAPHFVWAVRAELGGRLCGDEETCPALERGGLRIITSLDWNLQQAAEKWVTAGVLLPKADDPEAFARELGVPYADWMEKLEQMEVNNGALIAMDYQTGEIVAYVGSAGYYRNDLASKKFQPQFDVLGNGWRQPGSAVKPFDYVTGINDRTMTAATMFMDVTTRFEGGYTPKNYDLLERGPMRMRSALQWSLNIAPVKALEISGIDHVFDMMRRFGMEFQTERPRAGLSLALGTEVAHPRDVATAYGTLANEGRFIGHTHIIRITDAAGEELGEPRTVPVGEPVVTPQAAYIMTHMLESNTRPRQNPVWGQFALRDTNDERRPATLKTGTTQDANDLVAFGYIAPPDEAGRAAGQYALVVGSWNGNSDGSPVTRPDNPVISTDVAAPVWQGFLTEVTRSWPIQTFPRPGGIVEADVDAWSGGRPTEFTTETVTEVFIDGTVPPEDTTKRGLEVIEDEDGNLYLWRDGCAGTPETRGFLVLDDVEQDRPAWHAANLEWIERARRGTGVAGGPDPQVETETSYIFNRRFTPYGSSWGAPFPPTDTCDEAPSPSPSPTDSPSPSPTEVPTEAPTEPPPPTEAPTEPPPPPPPPTPTPTPTPTATPTDPPASPGESPESTEPP
jgi:membrane peptidoglycan carboxypeptidase